MNNVSGVQKIDGTEHVVHQCLHVLVREIVYGVGEDGAQILVEMLHDDEDVRELLRRRNDDVDELRGEQVRLHFGQLTKDRDLTVDLAAFINVSGDVADELDRDELTALLMPRFDDLTEATFPNEGKYVVLSDDVFPDGRKQDFSTWLLHI